MAEKSPDQIVAEIDRKQNEEDKDLIPRAGRMLKEKFMKLMTSEPKEKEKKPVEKAKGGRVSSASKRADGCAIRGKTRA